MKESEENFQMLSGVEVKRIASEFALSLLKFSEGRAQIDFSIEQVEGMFDTFMRSNSDEKF